MQTQTMYPHVKVKVAQEDDDYEGFVIPLQDFNSLTIRDLSPEKECKHLKAAKVPKSYVPRSITPSPSLPRFAKKSGQKTEESAKPRPRASYIPRPRAVMSSPDNDQILGNRNEMRLDRLSVLKTEAESKETAHTSCITKGKKGLGTDIAVPRAHIVKAKPCFRT